MSDQKPMDIYSSRLDIPFNVAAYCRGHKYSVEAVNLAKAIREQETAVLELKLAEMLAAAKNENYERALLSIKAKMERDPND